MIRDIAIAGGRLCQGCPRTASLVSGLDRLARLAPLAAEDVEDLALLTCAGCVADVECVNETGTGWVLSLAPRDRVSL